MNPRTFSLADLFAITAETVPERDALDCGLTGHLTIQYSLFNTDCRIDGSGHLSQQHLSLKHLSLKRRDA